jgi:hypothetical protein
MIRTVSAILLSGVVGAGSVATYDRIVPPPAQPAVVDLSALTQEVRQIKAAVDAQQQSTNQFITDISAVIKQEQAGLLVIHQDLLRQEAAEDAVRAQAQARVNKLNSDFSDLQKAMPR